MAALWLGAAALFFAYFLLLAGRYSLRASLVFVWPLFSLYCLALARWGSAVPWLFAPIAAGLLLLLGWCIFAPRFPKGGPEPDVILVLGLRRDGTLPEALWEERITLAVALSRRYPHCPLVLTGGRVFGETEAECEALSREIAARGVPKEKLILERDSRTSFENFLLCRPYLSGRRVAVVTNFFHARRAYLLARATVPDGQFSFYTGKFCGLILPHLLLREIVTFSVDLLRGRMK